MSQVPAPDLLGEAHVPRARWATRRRKVLLGLLSAVLVVAGALGAGRLLTRPAAPTSTPPGLSSATVVRRDLVSREQVDGTLGYAGQYTVFNQYSAGGGTGAGGGGVVTWLPAQGDVIGRGQALYRVNGVPIPLFYGDQPFWRRLEEGVSGDDVRELEENLLALGYATNADLATTGDFTSADTAAVRRWQEALGVPDSGTVNPGDVAVLAGEARVEDLKASVGASISAGAQVLSATSTTRVVDVNLEASLQALVKDGDPVQVSIPNGTTTTGKVQSVAKVATPSSSSEPGSGSGTGPGQGTGSGSSSGSSSPTVAVTISLDDPAATGSLDQAPVTVSIISDEARGVLAVPISALLARQQGGYGVEVVDGDGHTHVVAVQTGLFDDQDSLVAISGSGVREGTRVVVPSIS